MKRKGALLRSLSLGACLIATVCAAQLPQKPGMQFDMFPGYNGLLPEAAWFPVVFEVKNDGPSFTGDIELEADAIGGGPARSTIVELPTGSLKRLVVPAFGRYGSGWNARLLDERNRERSQSSLPLLQSRTIIDWKGRLIGALANQRGGPTFPQVQGMRAPTTQPVCAYFQTSIFPDNPIVLERLNAIYLNSEKIAELRDGQVKALMAWLHGGGHLIVGVEQISDINASPWLRAIFPCELTGSRSLDKHAELQTWLRTPMTSPDDRLFRWTMGMPGGMGGNRGPSISAGDQRDDPVFEGAPLPVSTCNVTGGRILAGASEAPLVVSSDCDRGRVTALLFSPEREPARSWKNLPWMWARLAEVPSAVFNTSDTRNRYKLSSDGIFGAMVDSRQVHKPPVSWLLALLIAYLAVIGPFDRWWLRKINKPMLTWITFPCYVVAFSLLIYFIGYKLRAGDSEWNELHLVDVFANGEQAELRGRTYASIYSPANQHYKISNSAKVATLRSEYMGSTSTQDKGGARVTQHGDSFIADLLVLVWTSQLCVSDWWHSAPLPITLSVSRNGEDCTITVDNRLDRPLQSMRLAIAQRMLELGEVPAKQKKTISMRLGQGIPIGDFVWQHGGAVFQSVMQQRQATFGGFGGFANARIENPADATEAASFLSQLLERQPNVAFVTPPGLDLSSVVDHGQAVLVAWSADYTPIPPINQFKPLRSHRDTLWRVSCPITQ